jgi:hypothetical protein
MGYHKDNIRMMKQPKQLQSTPPHMSYTWPSFCCWTNWLFKCLGLQVGRFELPRLHFGEQVLNHGTTIFIKYIYYLSLIYKR